MNRDRWRSLLSYVLLVCGPVLFFLGARTFLESHLAQSAAARDFRAAGYSRSAPYDRASRLKTGDILGRLTIPRLSTELYVMEGDDERDLRRGPGHLADTAMPGSRGNCVIAGHRDTHFRILSEIRRGDEIAMQTNAGTFQYRVQNISVVSPSDVRTLQPTSNAVLHLVTCYPFYYVGSAPKRLVVEATLAPESSPPLAFSAQKQNK